MIWAFSKVQHLIHGAEGGSHPWRRPLQCIGPRGVHVDAEERAAWWPGDKGRGAWTQIVGRDMDRTR